MAKKGRFIEKPSEVNELIVFGNMVDAVLIKFKANVFDKETKKEVIEVEYKPTEYMTWIEEIYPSDEDDYNSTTGNFHSKFPMDMVGHIEPRTEGTWILMLCDYKGNKCSIFEKINQNLLEKNRKLRSQIELKDSILVGLNAEMNEIIKHPEEGMKRLFKLGKVVKESMTPTTIVTSGSEVSGLESKGGQ